LFCLLFWNALMLHSRTKNTCKLKILSSYPLTPPLHFHEMSLTRVKSGESWSKHTSASPPLKNIAEGEKEKESNHCPPPPPFFLRQSFDLSIQKDKLSMKLLLNSIVHSFPKKSNSCEMWFAFYLTYLTAFLKGLKEIVTCTLHLWDTCHERYFTSCVCLIKVTWILIISFDSILQVFIRRDAW